MSLIMLADFDGDGKADLAVLDSAGGWTILFSAMNYAQGGPYTFSAP